MSQTTFRAQLKKSSGITLMLVPHNENAVFKIRINFRILSFILSIISLVAILAPLSVYLRSQELKEKQLIFGVSHSWTTLIEHYNDRIEKVYGTMENLFVVGEKHYSYLWPNAEKTTRTKLVSLEKFSETFEKNSQKIRITLHFLSIVEKAFRSLPLGWPIESGYITSIYGQRESPFGGLTDDFHTGYDFANGIGTDIRATADGLVIFTAGDTSGYGNHLQIRHDTGLITLYGHAKELFVAEGEYVKRGQKIAEIGVSGSSTGPHVHYEVRVEKKPPFQMVSVPLNPLPFILEQP